MNCTNRKVSKPTGMAASLTMLILCTLAGAALPLRAQTDPREGAPLASASWLQPGYNAAHTGYNNKEKTLYVRECCRSHANLVLPDQRRDQLSPADVGQHGVRGLH